MHDPDAVTLGERHHFFKKFQIHALRGGVRREPQNHHLRARHGFHDGALQFLQEIHARNHFHGPDVGARDNGAVNVDGIRGVRNKDRIAAVAAGQHQMREPLFGADRDDCFLIRIEVNVIAPFIPVAHRLSEAPDPFGDRVAVGVFFSRRLNHLVDDVLRCGTIRITHGKIDDVLTAVTCCHLEFAGDVEHIRGQPFNARKFGIHDFSFSQKVLLNLVDWCGTGDPVPCSS